MENPERTQDSLAKRAKLDESARPERSARSFTPMAQQSHARRIRNLWSGLCEAGDYQNVVPSLSNFGLIGDGITRFFDKEGSPLLSWAFLSGKSAEVLKFYREIVADEALQHVLRENNYNVIHSFLRAEDYAEGKRKVDKKRHQNRIETFQVLLALDFDGVKAFMDDEVPKAGYSEKIMSDFELALKDHRSAFPQASNI